MTGIGPVTAYGLGIQPLWEAMLEGRSAIDRIRAFDASAFDCQVAAELPADALDIRKIVPKSYRKSTKVMCRDIELAVAAAAEAVRDARLNTKGIDPDAEPTIPPDRFGCQIGAGLICADVDELGVALATSQKNVSEADAIDLHHWGEEGMHHLTPLWMLKYLPNMLACHVTIVHDCRGPSNTITCCEASSALCLGESMRVIQRGAADACLTGGAEHKLNILAYLRQQMARRLAKTNGEVDPKTVARPFDPSSTGTVIGEGGGILVVEEHDTADAHGREAYAVIAGFGASQCQLPDTIGLKLNPDDPAMAAAMRRAINQAGLQPDEIDAVVPFGSGIPSVDRAEAAALRSVFGDHAAKLPLVTTIPFTGNCGAGNGAVAMSVAAMCLREQMLPARLNSEPVEGLDAGACDTRQAQLTNILVATTSQGGQNAAVVLRKL